MLTISLVKTDAISQIGFLLKPKLSMWKEFTWKYVPIFERMTNPLVTDAISLKLIEFIFLTYNKLQEKMSLKEGT